MILIVLGLLFTLENLNVIDFDWYNLWRLWPVVLVLWGISILPAKNIVKSILVIIVLGASVYYMLENNVEWENSRSYSYQFYDDDDNSYRFEQDFTIPMNDSVKYAKLEMDVAASSFLLFEDNTDLVDFDKSGSNMDYKYTVMQQDSTAEMKIFLEDDFTVNHRKNNTIDMGVSTFPVWNMSFDVGAAKADFDLSEIKISDLDIEGGAASIDVKLGDNYYYTKVDIESGASSIKIKIPEESGCDLRISSVLSGKNINGFEKIDHGHYQTSNYESAKNKIDIEVETAVSSYSIIRY